jgi:crotonobetainyl-CoA:carnitine CoA-transferase CaiB-like acyl-CoA transferase
VIGILAALLERQRTGRGRHLDVGMAVGCVPLNVMALGMRDAGQDDPAPGDGPLTGGLPCFRVYRARNGWLAVGALEPKFWREFCRVLGLAELAGEGFAAGERRDDVVHLVERRLAEADAEEWERRFRGVDTCVERVRSPGEVLADPWLRESGTIGTAADPAGRPLAVFRALPSWSDPAALGPAPALGEHTAELLGAIAGKP